MGSNSYSIIENFLQFLDCVLGFTVYPYGKAAIDTCKLNDLMNIYIL